MLDKLDPNWVAAIVTTVGTYLFHKIWGLFSDKQKRILESVSKEITSITHQLVLTAPPGTTVAQIILWAKGAAAIQLAKVGLRPDQNAITTAVVDAVIADAVKYFVETHPDPKSLTPPILGKLAGSPNTP